MVYKSLKFEGFCFCFQDRVSLCSFGACPELAPEDYVGLKLTEICLPLPSKCMRHHQRIMFLILDRVDMIIKYTVFTK